MKNLISFVSHDIPGDHHLLDAYSRTITGVVGNVSDAVVHIEIHKKLRNKRTNETILQPASGSGFIISSDGYIITNAHVVKMPSG